MRALLLFCCFAAPALAEGDVGARLVQLLNAPDEEKHFTGAPVTLDARDASVPDVLRLIASTSGLNLIWDDDVEAEKVSLAVKKVPWDQLLDLVVRQKNLKVVVSGNVIQLLTSARFLRRLEQRKQELRGGATGETEQRLALVPIAYSDAKGMAHLLDNLLP
jgi:type IV pilus assembly protein PilQ